MVSCFFRPIICNIFHSFFLLLLIQPMLVLTCDHQSLSFITSLNSICWFFRLSFYRNSVFLWTWVESMWELFRLPALNTPMRSWILLFGFDSEYFFWLVDLRLVICWDRRNYRLHTLLASHSVYILDTIQALGVGFDSEHSLIDGWSCQ